MRQLQGGCYGIPQVIKQPLVKPLIEIYKGVLPWFLKHIRWRKYLNGRTFKDFFVVKVSFNGMSKSVFFGVDYFAKNVVECMGQWVEVFRHWESVYKLRLLEWLTFELNFLKCFFCMLTRLFDIQEFCMTAWPMALFSVLVNGLFLLVFKQVHSQVGTFNDVCDKAANNLRLQR